MDSQTGFAKQPLGPLIDDFHHAKQGAFKSGLDHQATERRTAKSQSGLLPDRHRQPREPQALDKMR